MMLTASPLRTAGLILVLLAGSVPAWGEPGRARTDAVLSRLIRDRGMTVDALGLGQPITPEELAVYARRVVIDL
jgi:hypothetical protein